MAGHEPLIPPQSTFNHLTVKALKALGGRAHRQAIRDKAIQVGDFSKAQLTVPQPFQNPEHRRAYPTKVGYRLAWALTDLKNRGVVRKEGDGIWSLATHRPSSAVSSGSISNGHVEERRSRLNKGPADPRVEAGEDENPVRHSSTDQATAASPASMPLPYPDWIYYPIREAPPQWAHDFVQAVAGTRTAIDSADVSDLTSDRVLAELRPGLQTLGFRVESGKQQHDRIRLPVLFGDHGAPRLTYEVDAVHEGLGVVVEVEAGRGARGNAVYRDLIRASLIVDARFFALGVMREYRHMSGGRQIKVGSYHDAKGLLDAIFASQRLRLPFDGILLFGY